MDPIVFPEDGPDPTTLNPLSLVMGATVLLLFVAGYRKEATDITS